MQPDLWSLYRQMLRCRLFEEAVADLWHQGLISGEMHLGIGEEGIIAGVLDHIQEGDALALDHRGTAAMLMRGIDPLELLREFLGHPEGLCAGQGGHMHLFSKDHLAASSGIVGASGPTAAGFALAAQYLRPNAVAVAFFGEGALNQGMLLESLNLAVAWGLPVLFVCKDNDWAITTRSVAQTGGTPTERARGFGLPAIEVDGSDVQLVWHAAKDGVARGRSGEGPFFIHAHCAHPEGHLIDDPLLRVARRPLRELPPMVAGLTRSFLKRHGAPLRERLAALRSILPLASQAASKDYRTMDPVAQCRSLLAGDPDLLARIEREAQEEVQGVLDQVLPARSAEGGGS